MNFLTEALSLYVSLDLPRGGVHIVARFRLSAHTLQVEIVVLLCRTHAFLFLSTGSQEMSTFLARTITSPVLSFILLLFMRRLAVAL